MQGSTLLWSPHNPLACPAAPCAAMSAKIKESMRLIQSYGVPADRILVRTPVLPAAVGVGCCIGLSCVVWCA